VSHDPSRKHFLAKLIGLVAVAGLAPKLLAKRAVPAAPVPNQPKSDALIAIRPDSRAVARRAGAA
jgi:hypothetical protein